MFCWRISKYNPKFRDENGFYSKNEWTDYSDIGKTFEGKLFTEQEYLNVEKSYISAIDSFMDCLQLDKLQVTHLIGHGLYKDQMLIEGILIKNNEWYDKDLIKFIAQANLRNKLNCRLESSSLIVRFSWDYYLIIGSLNKCPQAMEKISQSGLFVEEVNPEYALDE